MGQGHTGWGQQCLFYTSLDSSKTFISRSQMPLASSWLTVPVVCSRGLTCDSALSWFLSLSLQLLLLYFSHFPPPKRGYSPNIFGFSCPCANSPTSDMMHHIGSGSPHLSLQVLACVSSCLSEIFTCKSLQQLKLSISKSNSSSLTFCSNPLHPCFSSSLQGQLHGHHLRAHGCRISGPATDQLNRMCIFNQSPVTCGHVTV